MKRFSKCLRERVCDEMAKNEKALKMKRNKKTEGKFRTRWGQFKGLLRQVINMPLYLSLTSLKQVSCGGSLACHCSMPQKTRTIAVGQWNAAIDPMYRGRPKKHRNMRHIVTVFTPATIARFSCSVY